MLVQPVPLDYSVASVYVQHNGTIAAVDLVFVDWFGKTNEDLMAQQLSVIALEPAPLREIEEHIRSCDKAGEQDACMRWAG